MKKRVISILLVSMLAVSMLAGCSSTGALNAPAATAPAATTAAAAPATDSTAPAAPAAPADPDYRMGDSKTFDLQMQCHQSGDQARLSVQPTVDTIIRDSQGTINVELFTAGTLMPASETFNAVKKGDLDIAIWAEGMFASIIPVTEIGSGLPLTFATSSEAYMFMWHRGFVDIMREEYAKHNIYYFPWQVYEASIITKKPVTKFSDLKGMKIRAGGSMALTLNELGASVVSIAGPELYNAISSGVIDGTTWGDAGPMYEMKFHEVAKNYLQPELVGGFWSGLYVNMDLWKSFSAEQRFTFESAVLHGGREHIERTKTSYYRALTIMQRDFGVSVNRLSDEELASAQTAAAAVRAKLAAKDPLNAKVIKMVEDFVAEKGDATKVTPPLGPLGNRR